MNKFFCIKFELYIDSNYKYKDKNCVDCENCIYKGVEADMEAKYMSRRKKELFWEHFLKSLNCGEYDYYELYDYEIDLNEEEIKYCVNGLYNCDLKKVLENRGYIVDIIDRRHFGRYPKSNLKCYLINGLKVMIIKDTVQGIEFKEDSIKTDIKPYKKKVHWDRTDEENWDSYNCFNEDENMYYRPCFGKGY